MTMETLPAWWTAINTPMSRETGAIFIGALFVLGVAMLVGSLWHDRIRDNRNFRHISRRC